MKFAILGGGVAGSLLNNVLTSDGHELTIFDQSHFQMRSGFGFLLLPNGVESLKQLGVWNKVAPYSLAIPQVNYYDQSGDLCNQLEFQNVYSISRADFIQALDIPSTPVIPENIFWDDEYHSFVSNGEIYKASQFDAVLGSDGAHSQTRLMLNPHADATPARTYEVMGIVKNQFLHQHLDEQLHKYAISNEGLALGLLPLKNGDVIWYLQVDSHKHGHPARNKTALLQFVKEKVGHCTNPLVQSLLNSEMETIYVWQGRILHETSTLAKDNVFLFGDAAHLFLPFTSQGTNSAIEDVAYFVSELRKGKSPSEFSDSYSSKRYSGVQDYIQSGIDMMNAFCNDNFSKTAAQVPISLPS
jgi:FAD-dependent urate hydroxylase